MSVTSLYLTNLPLGITSEELKHQLTTNHPTVFSTPYEDTEIHCQVFIRNNTPCAVVRGLDYNFEKLLLETRGLEITHRSRNSRIVGIKPDLGDERNADGSFKYSVAASYKREFLERVGISHKQIPLIFKPSFWSSVNVAVMGGNREGDKRDKSLIRIDKPPKRINFDALKSTGGLNYCREQGPRDTYSRIMFHSILEQIQAIAKLNYNADLMKDNSSCSLPRFMSVDCQLKATISSCVGLGKDGSIIDIEEISRQNGFVTLDALDESLINRPFLDGLVSQCWRCKSPFTVIGINLNLTWLAGRCECPLDRFGFYGGYRWIGEDFTRLTMDRKKNGMPKLQIWHHPLKQIYRDATQYRQVVLPLIEEEWFYYSLEFGQDNRTDAIVSLKELIETTTAGKNSTEEYNLFAIQVLVPKVKVWTPENKGCITRVTLRWAGHAAEAIVYRMQSATDDNIQVILRFKVPVNFRVLQLNDHVTLIPRPSKHEYNCIRKALNNWVDNPTNSSSLSQVLLDPGRPPSISRWGKDELIECNQDGGIQKLRMSELLQSLDETQIRALDVAEKSSVSIIQGPPGTGKTFCVAALALWLAHREEGVVVVATPSNYAADGVAVALNNMMTSFSIKQTVLRIYSVTKAQRLLDIGNAHDGEFDTLHEEIRKSPDWLNDKDVTEMDIIKAKVNKGREFLLTEQQARNLAKHEGNIQTQVINRYKIIVSTVGCLSDKRLGGLANSNKITSLVLDEAGQLNQPSVLILLQLLPKRLVLAGDHLQLPSTVLSFAAYTAGLQLSLMEMLSSMDRDTSETYPCPPPWTILLVQYRMAPPIRELVSNLTYDGRLRDAILVQDRELDSCMGSLLKRMQGKRVGVLDHKGCEQNSPNGCGFYNEKEIFVISKLISTLQDDGIPMEKITVLSFYDEQRSRLIKKLGKEMDIRNVDAFQGRENAIIIVSFVRANTTSNTDMGFLTSLNRINVAISRAQQFLFIACNLEFFRKSQLQHMTKLCRLIRNVGQIL